MPATTTTWEDLVTVALLGTDRRPLPDALPPNWAGPAADPGSDPTSVVLGWAARHRAAVRAGSALPVGSPPTAVPPADREPGGAEAQQELAEALERGTPGGVNDALSVLVDQDAAPAAEHWTALAALAAGNPRVDRTLLATALGVRGVWFVAQNPDWARLAAALHSRRPETAA
jgi:hypothetical protein